MKLKSISVLEEQVMNIIWECGQCSIRDVMQKINTKDKHLAYTTVATIVQRLHEKGIVAKVEKDGSFIYVPKISKEKYSKSLAQSFISKFLNSFGDVGLSSFAQSIDKLPKQKRDYLLGLLEDYGKTK